MTMKDHLFLIDPSKIKEDCLGGCFGCPHWYGMEFNPPTFCKPEEETCRRCWGRTYKEPKKKTVENE